MLTRKSRQVRFKATTLLLPLARRGSAMVLAMMVVVLLMGIVSGLAIIVSPLFFLLLVMLMAIACVLTVISNMAPQNGPAVVPSDAFLRDDADARDFRADKGQRRNR